MVRTCYLHGGMPKTGSTTIQLAFHGFSSSKLVFAPLINPNHTYALRVMFDAEYKEYLRNLPARRVSKEVLAQADGLLETFHAFLRNDTRDVLISSEDLSAYASYSFVDKMLAVLNEYFDEILFIGYVRAPDTYVTSSLQQQLQGEVIRFDPTLAYPNYRSMFQPWFDRLGAKNVILAEYNSAKLLEGDVVLDFASRIGVDFPDFIPKRMNTRQSAEAVAVQQLWNRKFASQKLSFLTRARISYGRRKVLSYGEHNFQVNLQNLQALIQANQDDIAWIEDKLGSNFESSSKGSQNDIFFSDEQTFYEFAVEAEQKFWCWVKSGWHWKNDGLLALEAFGRTLLGRE